MTTRTGDDRVPSDPRFDAAWRTASNEEPPAAIDAAILAAARREVGAKPQSLEMQAATRARRRWWPLAAAATVAVIAVGVVQRAGHDELIAPPGGSAIVTDMPAQSVKSIAETLQPAPEASRPDEGRADAAPSAGGEAGEGRTRTESAPAAQAARNAQLAARPDAPRRSKPNAAPPLEKTSESDASTAVPQEKKSEPITSTAAPMPEPFPGASPKVAPSVVAPGAPAAGESAERGAAQRREAAAPAKLAAPPTPSAAAPMPPAAPGTPYAAPAPPMPPAASFADSARASAQNAVRPAPTAEAATAGAAEEARIKDRAPLPIADWIALIRRLRDENKTVEAARELAAFRTAHADHEKLLPPDLRDWHPAER